MIKSSIRTVCLLTLVVASTTHGETLSITTWNAAGFTDNTSTPVTTELSIVDGGETLVLDITWTPFDTAEPAQGIWQLYDGNVSMGVGANGDGDDTNWLHGSEGVNYTIAVDQAQTTLAASKAVEVGINYGYLRGTTANADFTWVSSAQTTTQTISGFDNDNAADANTLATFDGTLAFEIYDGYGGHTNYAGTLTKGSTDKGRLTRGNWEINVGITQVPEPSTLALTCLGLLGLIGYGQRRRR
jgi:hypothetical protein